MAENASDNAIAIGWFAHMSEGWCLIPSTLINCLYQGLTFSTFVQF